MTHELKTAGTTAFSADFVERLRLADRMFRRTDRGESTLRYAICRSAISALARVDSFYIGFFRDEDLFYIPYIYDHDVFLQPDISKLSKRGVAHWVRMSKRTYAYREDNGAKLTHAIPFGNTDEMSLDAAIVPLIDPVSDDVAGIISIQSLAADSYDDQVIRALEWLARALMHSLARDVADHDELRLYDLYPELDSSLILGEMDLITEVNTRLTRLRRAIGLLAQEAAASPMASLAERARDVQLLCEHIQVEIGQLVGRLGPADGSPGISPHLALTPREEEVARLIADDNLTNAQLAKQLHISEKTVKAHVGSVLRKLGVTQRSAIAWVVGPVSEQNRH
ncbi:helix-turn-helix transcriptional regulator [Rudaeicoccus suwonensis]|uniref:Regulatory LuxR family protein n=1 Tax=Rudaeicoccus suwonensis TaxID=657409 RepID=A0A561E186_9MICO|nr:helix-turn-helix transcriptional regulator [Rudaeicoccus suwonensis]TWE09374.1 regulatory LuxR family protein [Rudaeicoccus suwonensis]